LLSHEHTVIVSKHDLLSQDCFKEKKNRRTGLLGEGIALQYLRKQHSASRNLEINWVNEELETGLPYDLNIYDNEKKEIVEYIEVKSTSLEWRDIFEVSSNEWNYAKEHGKMYTILRVSGVDVKDESKDILECSVVVYNDPVELEKQGILKTQYQVSVAS